MKAGTIFRPFTTRTNKTNSPKYTTTRTMQNPRISFSTIIMVLFFLAIGLHNVCGQDTLVTEVFFAKGSDKPAAIPSLPEGSKIISVWGFASIEGTDTDNKALAQRRADAVASTFDGYDGPSVGEGSTDKWGSKLSDNRKVIIVFVTNQRNADDNGWDNSTTTDPGFAGMDINNDDRIKQAMADLGEDTTTMVSIFGDTLPISTGSIDSLGQGNSSPKDSNHLTTPIIVTLRDTVVLTDTVTVRDTVMRVVQVLPERQAIRFLMAKGKTKAEAVAHLDEQARLGEIVDMQTWEKTKPAKDYKSIKTQPRKKKTSRLKKTRGLSERGGILNKWFPNRNCG